MGINIKFILCLNPYHLKWKKRKCKDELANITISFIDN